MKFNFYYWGTNVKPKWKVWYKSGFLAVFFGRLDMYVKLW